MKKKIAIVSSDDIIIYQPSILNLYDFLKDSFDISIISFEPKYLGNKKDNERDINYLQVPPLSGKIRRITDLGINRILKTVDKNIFRISYRSSFVRKLKQRILADALKKTDHDIFIAVDPMPLYTVQQVKGKAHFFSLEIIPGDPYLKKADRSLISSVIIQSEIRYRYLFDKTELPVFYIQNAPFCKNKVLNENARSGLIWAGTIVKDFGVLSCFDFLRTYPEQRFYFRGGIVPDTKNIIEKKYGDLLDSQQAILDSSYLPAEEYIKFLSGFRIGFCFYDLDLIKSNFNYETAPSGKVFMYLAAGLPVIAVRISGFGFIEETRSGVLIDDYAPVTIQRAIQTIEDHYNEFSANSYRAFEMYCFDKNAVHLRKALLEEVF